MWREARGPGLRVYQLMQKTKIAERADHFATEFHCLLTPNGEIIPGLFVLELGDVVNSWL